MNGPWWAWGESVNGNQPGDFAKAWRHVHDIFSSVGANNATWVWCPVVDNAGQYTPMAGLYPGDAYVDWTCLDGYNWNGPWLSFDQVFRSSYDTVMSIAPSKPMVIGEVASTESGGSKAAWITDALTKMATSYPQIKAFLWSEFRDGMDWPIETSSSSQTAFAQGIASPAYAANQFGSIDGGRISPLP
jgi:beta-mannanase